MSMPNFTHTHTIFYVFGQQESKVTSVCDVLECYKWNLTGHTVGVQRTREPIKMQTVSHSSQSLIQK